MSRAKTVLEQHGDSYLTKVTVDIFGKPPKVSKDVYLEHDFTVEVSWNLEEDHRDWGIKSLMPIVPDQEIDLLFKEPTEDEDIEHIINYKMRDVQVRFEVSKEKFLFWPSLQIIPDRLEIDFNKNRSTLYFSIS